MEIDFQTKDDKMQMVLQFKEEFDALMDKYPDLKLGAFIDGSIRVYCLSNTSKQIEI